MKTLNLKSLPTSLQIVAAIVFALPVLPACAQDAPKAAPAGASQVKPAIPATPEKTASGADAAPQVDRGAAYFHMGMAGIYEEEAVTEGHTELISRAIDEYKYALDADPNSPAINDSLAELYFHSGRVREAEATARGLLKAVPNDINAHKLLGRIYLRQLGEGQNAGASDADQGKELDLAIAEFEKIVALQPASVEDRMVLGQLYNVKHQPEKAELQFKSAQQIEPESEDVILNLASLYKESGDVRNAVKVIEAVPVNDRTAKMEFALGAAYEELKQPKDAIAAYQRSADMDPGDLRNIDALAQALLGNNQFDDALKLYQDLAQADSENPDPLVHIAEIQRRQGKYEDALATVKKARKLDPTSLEAGYNEGQILDILGRFDEAAASYEAMVDLTSHANGAYNNEEKNNRAIFLERLGAIYHEENKTDQAIAAYQKMIEMGGDIAVRGYQGEVDTYRDARQYDKAIDVARKAVEANPTDRDLKLMLAGELADQGKEDEGIALAKGLLTNTPNDRVVWLALGQMDIRLKRWKDAEDAFNKSSALTTKKEDRTYLFFLQGELDERQKHYEPAEKAFRQALDLDPANAMTLNYLGYMLADKGSRLTEALQMIRKAVEQDPGNGAYLDSLGWAYFKLGQYEMAEDNLRQAVARDQTDPTVHEHLGDLYEKTGRIRLAAAQWELSLAEFAKSPAADIEPGDVAKVQKKLETARVKLAKEENVLAPAKPE
jgi:tetratricopeptide (TPR) repeat protein